MRRGSLLTATPLRSVPVLCLSLTASSDADVHVLSHKMHLINLLFLSLYCTCEHGRENMVVAQHSSCQCSLHPFRYGYWRHFTWIRYTNTLNLVGHPSSIFYYPFPPPSTSPPSSTPRKPLNNSTFPSPTFSLPVLGNMH